MENKIYYRCGACGDLFRHDNQPISADEFEHCILEEDYDISYCGCQDRQINAMQVTRDMAKDAGDLSLEGTWI